MGIVYENAEPARFLGTCFAFRDSMYFLTARHCVGTLRAEQVGIELPSVNTSHSVRAIVPHPTADLAVLILNGDAPDIDTFRFFGVHALGQDFMAYGFPEDVFGETPPRPTERLFRGYIQRYMVFRSPEGYVYDALELSIGAPAGLSGGPLFQAHQPWLIIGIVTADLKSTTFLQSEETMEEPGRFHKTSTATYINYGVALQLEKQAAFLEQHIPAPKT